MYNPLKLINYIPFYFRKRFKNKYIIIESDDWGMAGSMGKDGIRYLESKYGYENFTRWTKDSLETLEDVSLLYEVLNKFRNSF